LGSYQVSKTGCINFDSSLKLELVFILARVLRPPGKSSKVLEFFLSYFKTLKSHQKYFGLEMKMSWKNSLGS